ncbi:MAG: phosphotransferase family protein [Gammaproteobacteria bacterium]|nr:MAG: phosphotransferase family protein [Gammaproteobacteria bacterium]TDJ38053.1 MAG: phosphotransferase family protein [Gammaproteobacteria bacterium]
MSDAPELTAVREAHRFDEQALLDYLAANLDGFEAPVTIRQFEGGQSNPTFLLEAASGNYVMRKQPPGELLPSAHQVDREHRVMDALRDSDVPVPRMFVSCEDPSVIGTKFYLMEKVEGRVFTDLLLPTLSAAERGAIYEDLARVLAALHCVDPISVGLESFGRPGNYYARQISRWSKQYLASKTEDLPEMDRLMSWLPSHIPESEERVIVHGDFRLGNVLIHPTEPRIAGVIDWELSTLGHPLADLGYVCMDYHADSYYSEGLNRADLSDLGIPSEQQMLDYYCAFAGRANVENWSFYVIYNLFRAAGIIQGVYKRGLDGNASSDSALEFKDACRVRAERAWALVEAL